jgi:hypothetical protein
MTRPTSKQIASRKNGGKGSAFSTRVKENGYKAEDRNQAVVSLFYV